MCVCVCVCVCVGGGENGKGEMYVKHRKQEWVFLKRMKVCRREEDQNFHIWAYILFEWPLSSIKGANVQNILPLVFFACFCHFMGKSPLYSFMLFSTISRKVMKLRNFEWSNFISTYWCHNAHEHTKHANSA